MKKSTRIVKRLLALFLVVLMSINSLGAVVSDNDGSAFITKAEFDSLKNNFQSQIDQYNTSIDSKIDGAIASYLAGVSVAHKINLKPMIENYSDIRWVNGLFEKTHRKTFYDTYENDGILEWRRSYFNHHRYLRLKRIMLTVPIVANGEQLGIIIWHTVDDNELITGIRDTASQSDPELDWGPAIKVLELHKNNNRNYVYNLNGEPYFMEEQVMSDSICAAPIVVSEDPVRPDGANDSLWSFVRKNRFVGWQHTGGTDTYFKWNSLATGEFAKFEFRIRAWNGSTWASEYLAAHNIALSSKNTVIGFPHTYSDDPKAQNSYRSRYNTYNTHQDYTKYLVYHKYGVNAHRDRYDSQAQADADKAQFNNMMLGVDDTTEANVGYVIESDESLIGYKLRFDYSNTEWVDMVVSGTDVTLAPPHLPFDAGFNFQTVKNIGRCGINGTVNGTIANCDMTSLPDSFRMPLWNRLKIQELANDNFVYNGSKNLRLGEGMPLSLKLSTSGKYVLKFKYDVKNNDLSDTVSPDHEVKLYIKRDDFLTSNAPSDYYITEDGQSLNGYTINTNPDTMSTVEFEAKEGDNIWLRLSPKKLDPSGIYAKITDLSLELETT